MGSGTVAGGEVWVGKRGHPQPAWWCLGLKAKVVGQGCLMALVLVSWGLELIPERSQFVKAVLCASLTKDV